MTVVTVGTNDAADGTGDLIVTFVDANPQGVTTDGTRTALPGAPWGCYLLAPSVSPQAGCAVTLTPSSAQWESCSLIWQPPPHAAILWTAGGLLAGAAGEVVNPKWPPQTLPAAGKLDASAGISGRLSVRPALATLIPAAASLSGGTIGRLMTRGQTSGAGSLSGAASGPGTSAWQVAGLAAAAGSVRARGFMAAALAATIAVGAGTSGDARRSVQLWTVSGTIAGAAGISGNAVVGHQYFLAAKVSAAGGVTPAWSALARLTNYVRNPRPEGVSVGTVDGVSNTGPTSWWLLFANPDSMLAVTMIGTGTEGIIPYVDIRWNNASCPGGFMTVQTEGGIPVSSGVVWSYSVFCRLVGGSLTNISSIGLQILTDGTTTFFNGPTITPTSASLSSQWSHWDGVNITDSGMTNIAAGLVINANAGAVDLTLRIGAPKAEKASSASGSQYLLVPQVGFAPGGSGGSTSYVF